MRYLVTLLVLTFASSVSLLAQSSASMDKANPAATGPSTQITGCLAGKSQQYRLVETNGTAHALMGDDKTLGEHVGHMVTLDGYRDNDRDASASGNNGMSRGMRFFQVNNVASDNGKCHQ